jgi:outer membrane protein assembly factor BamE (lipoprotein component of BamABCDE complex)
MGMRVVTRHIGHSRWAPQKQDAAARDRRRGTAPAALAMLLAATSLAGCANAVGGSGTSVSGITRIYQRGYVLSEGALEQVPVGSSQEQVLLVLGTPSTVATVNGQVFYYISQTAKKVAFLKPEITEQKVLAIYFDKNNRVTRIAQYGMKDGKVFDFVSQTTPTSGEDLSLVQQLIGLVSF